MIKVGLSSSADLNISLSGGVADAGVIYQAVGGRFTVNASGIITPIKTGVGVVLVKNSSTNQVLRKIAIAIVADAELSSFQNIQSMATTVVSPGAGSAQVGDSATFIDQEVVTFDSDGEYVLQSATSGIKSNSIPMLTFDGVVQDGKTNAKRFDVVSVNGAKKKLKLYSNSITYDFLKLGTPTISTVGGQSAAFYNHTANVIRVDDPVLSLGTGDFTIELWVYPTSMNTFNSMFSSSDSFAFGHTNAGSLYLYANAWVASSPNSVINFSQWNHVALVRNGSSVKIYANGVEVASGTSAASYTMTNFAVGSHYDGNYSMSGGIRNLRVTKQARYTSTFTPFSVSSNVTGLTDASGNTVLKSNLNEISEGNIKWQDGVNLLPKIGTNCLVSYRV